MWGGKFPLFIRIGDWLAVSLGYFDERLESFDECLGSVDEGIAVIVVSSFGLTRWIFRVDWVVMSAPFCCKPFLLGSFGDDVGEDRRGLD